jgi:hypothetical protein
MSKRKRAATDVECTYDASDGRLVQVAHPGNVFYHYEGPRGEERRVRETFRNTGGTNHLVGPKGHERVLRWDSPGGSVYHYEVIDGVNFWSHRVGPLGESEHFRRVKGGTHLVSRSHFVHTDGSTTHYEGNDLWVERKVRREVPSSACSVPESFPNGYTQYFKGKHKHEAMVRKEVVTSMGTQVWHYKGKPGRERETLLGLPDGSLCHLGIEGQVTRRVFPNADEAVYGGESTEPFLLNVKYSDRTVEYEPRPGFDVDDFDFKCGDAFWLNSARITRQGFESRSWTLWHTRNEMFKYDRDNEERIVRIFRNVPDPMWMMQLLADNGEAVECEAPRAYVLWFRLREWVKQRATVLYWQERTQVRSCAPGGAGQLADCDAFKDDFQTQ